MGCGVIFHALSGYRLVTHDVFPAREGSQLAAIDQIDCFYKYIVFVYNECSPRSTVHGPQQNAAHRIHGQ